MVSLDLDKQLMIEACLRETNASRESRRAAWTCAASSVDMMPAKVESGHAVASHSHSHSQPRPSRIFLRCVRVNRLCKTQSMRFGGFGRRCVSRSAGKLNPAPRV
jgi:proteasome lid subunit RPN8/RPN11